MPPPLYLLSFRFKAKIYALEKSPPMSMRFWAEIEGLDCFTRNTAICFGHAEVTFGRLERFEQTDTKRKKRCLITRV
jgi:hypothetical protein